MARDRDMECPAVEVLVREASGDLAGPERRRVAEHLRICPACRAESRRLRGAWDLLDHCEVPPVSTGFSASVLRRVRSETMTAARPGLRRSVARWTAAIAATLLLGAGVGGWLLGSRAPDTAETPVAAAREITDEEIIRDLEIYENAELLGHLELVADLDVLEEIGERGESHR